MKKKLTIIILITLSLILVVWGASAWYLGEKAETFFKAVIQENIEIRGENLFRIELVDYQRTLFEAKAQLRISSEVPFLSEKFGEYQVNVTLLNGPIFIGETGVTFGSSRWYIEVDEANLPEEEAENLKQIFPQRLPTAMVRLDFKNNAHYSMTLKTELSDAQVTGVYNVESYTNRGAINLTALHFTLGKTQFNANNVQLSYQHQKALTAAYKPGTSALAISSLQVSDSRLLKPIDLSVKANSNISLSSNYLSGFLKVVLKQKNSADIPFDAAKLSVLFKGISADGFVSASEAHADLDNLRLQAEWELEENGEFPDGQDQITELYQQIDDKVAQLPELLTTGLFNKDSLVQFKVISDNSSGKSEAIGQLSMMDSKTYKKRGGVPLNIVSNNVGHQDNGSTYFVKTLISLIQGSATVKLDPSMLSILSTRASIDKSKFTIEIKNGQFWIQ